MQKTSLRLVNQVRGLLVEYGVIINKGISAVRSGLPVILDNADSGRS
jgi:transposase